MNISSQSLVEHHDVFLCYNSRDEAEVETLAKQLQQAGLRPWLDKWCLPPGTAWLETIEEQLQMIASVVVFIGQYGFGPWQRRELYSALRERARRELPIIPVILPSCVGEPQLPAFLARYTWVDCREKEPQDFIGKIKWGVEDQQKNTARQHDETERPTVLIASTSANAACRRLSDYCKGSGVRALLQSVENSREDFHQALQQANVCAQILTERDLISAELPQGLQRWRFETAKKVLTSSRVLQWRPPRLSEENIHDEQQRAWLMRPRVLSGPPNDFHQHVIQRAREAFELGKPVQSREKRIVIIKHSADDREALQQLLRVLEHDNLVCLPLENGTHLMDARRDLPRLDAVVVVLGKYSETWKQSRGMELAALAIRDDKPTCFYYHPYGKQGVPPVSDTQAVHIESREQLDRLAADILQPQPMGANR